MTSRRGVRAAFLATLATVALGLRLAHLASVASLVETHVVPGLDSWLEREIATAVARGDLLGGRLAPYESAPAYALGLGLVHRATGDGWVVPLVLQSVLGALAPLLLYVAGRRLASARVGLLGAALAAAYAPAVFYEGLTLKFALVPVVVSALLAALAVATSAARWAPAAVAAGALTALLVALRMNALAVLPVAVVWLMVGRGRETGPGAALLLGIGLLGVAVPLAVRRHVAAARGDAASLWGIHFYVGSRAGGDGGYTIVPGIADDVIGHVEDARALAEADEGHRLAPGEVSAYWFRRGIADIRRDPAAYLALEGRKLARLLAPGENDAFGDDWVTYAAESAVMRAGLTFGAIAPLALLGASLALARRMPLAWCVALAAAYAVSLLAFFVTSRYRLPIVPPLLLCAGVALGWLGDLLAGRRTMALVAATTLLVAVPAVLGTPGADLLRLLVILVLGVPIVAWLGGHPQGTT